MEFWTDGSRIQAPEGCSERNIIGWGAVCNRCVLVSNARLGGSNVNAEMLAIQNLLKNLISYRRKILREIQESDRKIVVITDSKTSKQIIEGYQKSPLEYDLDRSENYLFASIIVSLIDDLKNRFSVDVELRHVRGHGDNIGNTFADYVATQEAGRLFNQLQLQRGE